MSSLLKKPVWIRKKLSTESDFHSTKEILRHANLNTVCEEASCPNITECWSQRHVTFMILGDVCTRACSFCNVKTGKPNKKVDLNEPARIASTVKKLDLKHVVITSVDRDDLIDGGAAQFVRTIKLIRESNYKISVEVLVPDFLRKKDAIETVVMSKPDVLNHNLETVPRLYKSVRPGAKYFHSLRLLQAAKEIEPLIFTKSGIMLGFGETDEEVIQVLEDLRSADVDFVTIGQYLQPTLKHHKVVEFIHPGKFNYFKKVAMSKGFLMVSSSPFTRSSYHAGDDFRKLQSQRISNAKT